jgi:GTP cyclohydrolase II
MTIAPPSLYGDPVTLAVERALAELRSGRAVRITGPEGARLSIAVETLRPAALGALLAMSRGGLRLALTAERAAALGWRGGAAELSVQVLAGAGLETLRTIAGVSAPDQACPAAERTVDPDSMRPADVNERAALRLAKRARLLPTVLTLHDAGEGDPHLVEVSVSAVDADTGPGAIDLEKVSEAAVPLADAANCRLAVFRDRRDGTEHVAVLVGHVDPAAVVDVRVHSACLTGDLFGSLRCDCGDQLRGAIRRFAALGAGVLLYVAQEGRGIGLANKLRAYRLQQDGLDTIDANLHLGFAADERRYEVAARMLRELGVARIRLHTNNPRKVGALADAGIDVAGYRTLAGVVNPHNADYIRVRRERAGHLVPDLED